MNIQNININTSSANPLTMYKQKQQQQNNRHRETYDDDDNDSVSTTSSSSSASSKKCNELRRGRYTKSIVGLPIVNAITGEKYPWKVGSKEESNLWKVVNVIYCSDNFSKFYFYDSPEQYERFQRVKIDEEAKRAWRSSRDAL